VALEIEGGSLMTMSSRQMYAKRAQPLQSRPICRRHCSLVAGR
jgi:hypothetical protein